VGYCNTPNGGTKLLSAIEAHADWLVDNGMAQNVVNTLWDFATLKT
jgi:hypothetical protein